VCLGGQGATANRNGTSAPDYRFATKLRRRMRRRARVFTSVRTAARNFDLELAIATSIPPLAGSELLANAEFGGAICAVHTHLDLGRTDKLLTAAPCNSQHDQ
jgi:hypothetical protein